MFIVRPWNAISIRTKLCVNIFISMFKSQPWVVLWFVVHICLNSSISCPSHNLLIEFLIIWGICRKFSYYEELNEIETRIIQDFTTGWDYKLRRPFGMMTWPVILTNIEWDDPRCEIASFNISCKFPIALWLLLTLSLG